LADKFTLYQDVGDYKAVDQRSFAMSKILLPVMVCLLLAAQVTPAAAQQNNRIWFTWEQSQTSPELCETRGICEPLSKYTTRLIEEPSTAKAKEMVDAMAQLAKLRGHPDEHPNTPQMCRNVEAAKVLGFDPETWPMAEKLDTLVGLQGVYFSLQKLKAPEGYQGEFGEDVHAEVVQKFTAAGIPVLTEEQRDMTPGKPHLNIYFSNTNPDTGCWFSVFSSLSQTALLTRKHTVKFKAGTWGFGGGYSADHPDRDERTAIMIVIDRFISDFQTANPDGVERLAFLD
jgi:hypothetical protein